jgi:hypothetical protein
LFYSAFDLPLTRRDLLCFLSIYQRNWLRSDVKMLHHIVEKAVALYQKDFGREPPAHIQRIVSHLAAH